MINNINDFRMTKEPKINGKAIYTTNGAAREYGRVGCNFYTGCPHDCSYCYLKRGAPSHHLGGTEVRLKKCFKDKADALEVFAKEARKHIDTLRQTGLFLSFSTDPLISETRDLTISAMGFCVDAGIPVKVLTKNADFIDYPRFQLNMKAVGVREFVHFGFTLTGRDDMEPNASSNHDRIETMRSLHEQGFYTFASIEPVIDWQASMGVIEDSIDCCDHYKIGLRSGVKKDYYEPYGSCMNIRHMVSFIVNHNRTVYLKESARKLLKRVSTPGGYDVVMQQTVDMDGNISVSLSPDEP